MGNWIELETDASTGDVYLWKCDECGEEVTTRGNYCPECGDPKTSKGKNINTLVKALEAEHRKLREMQSATDKNVGTKYDELEIVRAISGLTEWQKHVQTDSNIDRDITVAIEALKAQLGTNLASLGTDCISREQAIDALRDYLVEKRCPDDGTLTCRLIENEVINKLPPIRPDKDKVSDLLYHIYSIQSPHLDISGVIAKKYYCEELWKELFGKESELPGWMN